MSHNWGYANGKKMGADIGIKPSRVTVTTHTRGPRVSKQPMKAAPPSMDIPQVRSPKMPSVAPMKMAKGGAVCAPSRGKSSGKTKR